MGSDIEIVHRLRRAMPCGRLDPSLNLFAKIKNTLLNVSLTDFMEKSTAK
jgi:hypothetical protein